MQKKTEAGLPVLRMRPIPKGRPHDAEAVAEVRSLLGDAPRRRDLLIEHLHRIQDSVGFVSIAHLNALAHEMAMAPAEVYEVVQPPGRVRTGHGVLCEHYAQPG
jgi:hypothetical protein